MPDVVEDIITAFNQSRFEVADDFDRMRSDNMKFYRSHAQSWVDGVYQEYGDDGWGQFATYGAALLASTGDVLLDFVQGVGSSTFLDPLRLGAGVKKGTAGGYLEDGLRVVGVVGGVMKLLKFGKYLRGASAIGGGVMSCTPTSAGKALVQSRLIAVPTVEQMAQGTMNVGNAAKPVFYGPTFVRTAGYPGAWLSDVIPNLRQAGAVVEAKQVQSVEDVVRLVDQNRGPVVFSVGWQSAAGIPGGGHTMMAYRPFFGSGVRLADQFGNMHTIKDMGQAGKLVIAGIDTTTIAIAGARPIQAGETIGRIGMVYKDAYIVRDAALLDVVANAPLAQRVGVPIYEIIDEEFWPKVGFAASMSPTAPPKLKKVGDRVRSAIAANPTGTPTAQQGAKPSPNASIPLSARATRVLSLLAPIGSKNEWKPLRARLVSSGIATNDVYPAISELEGWGLIAVERFGVDTLNIISVTRN